MAVARQEKSSKVYLTKIRLTLTIGFMLFIFKAYSQNTNLNSLLTQTQWNTLFPKRAGTLGVHPQGYTSDFYSYGNLMQAALEMSDYLVQIRIKPSIWGQLITITKKSTQFTYIYTDVDPWWHTNSTPENIIDVDFEDFINSTSSLNNKRELGAFLANISKETTGGWQLPVGSGSSGDYASWGLYYVHELGYNSTTGIGAYSQAHADYPPNPSVGYYGRGPIQLSWNYNYGQFSKFLFNDATVLLNNPDSIQQDGILAFKSAIWFWMMPQCPKPSAHQVMHDLWKAKVGDYSSSKMYTKGFAHTNNIINGGLECRGSSSAAFTQKVVLRSELYKYYLDIMGLTSSQITAEDTNGYSTLCYTSSTDAMENYLNCYYEVILLDNQFLHFETHPTSAQTVLLHWEIKEEKGNQFFDIQRSSDGINWERIGQIKSTNKSQPYNFKDLNPINGQNYYRLKITDMNNKATYSKISTIHFLQDIGHWVYPNPNQGIFNIEIKGLREEYYTVEVFDAIGREVHREIIKGNKKTLSLQGQASGIYTLKLKIGNQCYYTKITILH
ncbi:MAG: T9SS type A sorting domain-containing protein [Aureispira sp.]|nr:T9SS type A sorting domain-containing protein [Aureispira sp.]